MDISFILVQPAVAENIGASARAIKTMGFKNLCLVNPVIQPLDKKAWILAHGSDDILKKAKIYTDLDKVVRDFDFLIGTSAKRRRTNENYIKAEDLADFIVNKSAAIHKIGILFGREESGLSNEEIKICDIISYVSLANPFPSLNLSQAVMIYAFLLSPVCKKVPEIKTGQSTEESLRALKSKVRQILQKINMKQPHTIRPRIMERMSFLANEDIPLLHSLSNAILDILDGQNQLNHKTSSSDPDPGP
jgi:tRNA/rRNA methyltransferase